MSKNRTMLRVLSLLLAFLAVLGLFLEYAHQESQALTATVTRTGFTSTWTYTIDTDGKNTTCTITSVTVKATAALPKGAGQIRAALSVSPYTSWVKDLPKMAKNDTKTYSPGISWTVSYSAGANMLSLQNNATSDISGSNKSTTIKQPTYTPATYTVTYNANGGSGGASSTTVTEGSYITIGAAPTRSGYTFSSWSGYAPGASYGPVNGDVTFTANWYTCIYYNSNPGSSSTSPTVNGSYSTDQSGNIYYGGSRLATTGTTYDLYDFSSLGLRKKGYHVNSGAEWNSRSNGTGTSYSQYSAYSSGSFSAGQILYANWKPNTYRIRYNPNGGGSNVSGSMPVQTVTFDTSSRVLSNSFIRDGYKLSGWDRNPNASPSGSLDVVGDKGVIPGNALQDLSDGATLDLYAIWRPIEDSQTDIYVGKTLTGAGETDAFSFRVEPVEGWTNENESTVESGRHIGAELMPMPEGTPTGQRYKDVTVTGCRGNAGVLRTQSIGLITFDSPGWYMYRISEIIPDPKPDGITYDRTSYYVVAYVSFKNKELTGDAAQDYKLKVYSTTSWHNNQGSDKNRPDLKDISAVTDNGGNAASSNTVPRIFGKTGIGMQSVTVKFWNSDIQTVQPYVSFSISKNVTGNLGDLTKRFEFETVFTGLAANTTYSVYNDGMTAVSGFSGNAFTTNASGSATLKYRLRDGDGFQVDELPSEARFTVTEAKSDHKPAYTVKVNETSISSGSRNYDDTSLSTGSISMNRTGEMYDVRFINNRDLATNTGIIERGFPIIGAGILLVLALMITIALRKRI